MKKKFKFIFILSLSLSLFLSCQKRYGYLNKVRTGKFEIAQEQKQRKKVVQTEKTKHSEEQLKCEEQKRSESWVGPEIAVVADSGLIFITVPDIEEHGESLNPNPHELSQSRRKGPLNYYVIWALRAFRMFIFFLILGAFTGFGGVVTSGAQMIPFMVKLMGISSFIIISQAPLFFLLGVKSLQSIRETGGRGRFYSILAIGFGAFASYIIGIFFALGFMYLSIIGTTGFLALYLVSLFSIFSLIVNGKDSPDNKSSEGSILRLKSQKVKTLFLVISLILQILILLYLSYPK